MAVLASWLVLAMVDCRAGEEHRWRSTVTSERARQIAGQLFPDRCNPSGLACGITYDDRRGCPFEFVVVFPSAEPKNGEPRAAWVTLDKNGAVVEVTSMKKGTCQSGRT